MTTQEKIETAERLLRNCKALAIELHDSPKSLARDISYADGIISGLFWSEMRPDRVQEIQEELDEMLNKVWNR